MGYETNLEGQEALRHHPELIKARIRMAYGSVVAFEIEKGLAHRSVRDVLRGRTIRRTAMAIADFVGVPVQVLFPGRYISLHHTSPKGDSHRLNVEAA